MPEFNEYLWNAKTYVEKEEVFKAINEFKICGKQIKDICVIGMAYNMNKFDLTLEAIGKYMDAGFKFNPIHDGKNYYNENTRLNCSSIQ